MDKKEITVVETRKELNIANGFSFSQQHNGIKEAISIGGDVKDQDFYRQFILHPTLTVNLFKAARNILISSTHKPEKPKSNLPIFIH